jgi:uncharacterized membrane protein SpoIIM required for sporulation
MYKFIEERKDNWKRLEELLAKTEGVTGLKGLPRSEVRELGELYRRAAADLAIARAETRDRKLIKYLNSLVIRGHGMVYRAEGQGVGLIWNFFAKEFPRVFRETAGFTLASFSVFTLCAVIAFALSFSDQSFTDAIGLTQIQNFAQTDTRWWMELNQANQIGSSQILTNNIQVAFMAFALGALLGLGTIYILATNGLMVGGVLGTCFRTSPAFGGELLAFMVGHGVVELSCIFIAGGAGLMIGYSIVNPGDRSRMDSLKRGGIKAVKLAFGCAFLLVGAGVIEGFLSPSNLPVYVKYGTGVATGLAMYGYLFLAGRTEESARGSELNDL